MAAPADAKQAENPPPVSIAEAERYGELCKVRQMQRPLELLSKDAKTKGVSVEQELHNRGMKDTYDFLESCEKFPLKCDLMDLAELGAGFPLYFQFLQFLGFMLLLFLVIQSPVMAKNMSYNAMNTWRSDLTDDEVKFCNKCTGDNKGILGVGKTTAASDYGKSCKAHDISACGKYTKADLGDTEKGLWCCRSWCYVDEKCPIAKGSAEKNDLFFSYKACPDDPQQIEDCLWQDDIAYDKASLSEVPTSMISKGGFVLGGVTPGNAGKPPEHGIDGSFHALINFIALCFFCAALAFQKARMRHTESVVDAATTMPNDYAILCSGLPCTATEENAIADFWKKNALKDQEVDIVKVVIGWNLEEFNKLTDELKSLTKTRKKLITKGGLHADHPQVKSIQERMLDIKKQIVSAGPAMASRMTSTGICVVIFRTQADHRACLDRWTGFWPRWSNSEKGSLYGLCKGAPLPRWKDGSGREIATPTVKRADNPMDVNWEDLGRTTEERLKKFRNTTFLMLVLIGFASVCIGVLQNEEEGMKEERENEETGQIELKPNKALIVVPALLVTLLNLILNTSARIISRKEYHNSKSSEQGSTILKMATSLTINTSGVALVLKSLDGTKGWYVENGLVDAVYTMLVINSIFPPLLTALDIMGYFTVAVRRARNMAEKMEAAPRKEGELFKKYWEPSEFDLTRRYANALQTFISCALYQPIMPQVMIWGFLGIVLQYWIDKYMLLNVHKRPELEGPPCALVAHAMTRGFVTFGLPLSIVLFLSPSTQPSGRGALYLFMSFGLAVAAVTAVLPHAIQRMLLCSCICLKGEKFDEEQSAASLDYYEAQMVWPATLKYHKTHPLYKGLPEKFNPENLSPGAQMMSGADMRQNAGFTGQVTGADKVKIVEPMVLGAGAVYCLEADKTPKDSVVATSTVIDPASGLSAFAQPAQPVVMDSKIASAEEVAIPVQPAGVSDLAFAQPDQPVTDSTQAKESGPTVATVQAYLPGHPDSDADQGGQPIWEFETKSGFTAFDDDCQQYVEKIYQDFKSGKKGPKRRIKTRGKEINLDFKAMESQVEGSDHKRKIHRRT